MKILQCTLGSNLKSLSGFTYFVVESEGLGKLLLCRTGNGSVFFVDSKDLIVVRILCIYIVECSARADSHESPSDLLHGGALITGSSRFDMPR